MTRCLVGVGSNLGDSRTLVRQAMHACSSLPRTRALGLSSLWGSAPVDAEGPDYVNAVVALESELDPWTLLRALQQLEARAGRQRAFHHAPRTLDLDLLWVDGVTLQHPELTLPHPRMSQRAFVLLPLAEVAPDLVDARQLERVRGQRVWPMDNRDHGLVA